MALPVLQKREIRHGPSLLQRALRDTTPKRLLNKLSTAEKAHLEKLWWALAREEQRPDPHLWWEIWLYLAGRGSGKTRSGAEWVREKIKTGVKDIHFIGATAADVRDVMVNGRAGIIATCSETDFDIFGNHMGKPQYHAGKRKVTWNNGATALLFSAEKPNRLRGPQCEILWGDELAAWQYMEETYDNALLGLRLGIKPQACFTTTPRPLKLIRELLKDPTVCVTRGTSYDNKENLALSWYERIIKRYENTRLGRQELNAELLDDNPDALWDREVIDENRIREAPRELLSVVVAVDPAATSGENSADTGIICVGTDDGETHKDGYEHFYVLDDRTCHAKPIGWAKEAIKCYDYWLADRVVAEVNHGGEMVEAVIRAVKWSTNSSHTPGEDVAYETVRASRGKYVRAEPISALYEQGRVHHVGVHPELEDQMCQWSPNLNEKSPDRMDALVWAITSLIEGGVPRIRSV